MSRKLFKSQIIYVCLTAAPFIYIHIQLNKVAMNVSGQNKFLLLTVDSFVIGLLAVFMGVALAYSYAKVTDQAMVILDKKSEFV